MLRWYYRPSRNKLSVSWCSCLCRGITSLSTQTDDPFRHQPFEDNDIWRKISRDQQKKEPSERHVWRYTAELAYLLELCWRRNVTWACSRLEYGKHPGRIWALRFLRVGIRLQQRKRARPVEAVRDEAMYLRRLHAEHTIVESHGVLSITL